MLASVLQPHIWTANLLFIGLVRGLIVSLIAMGIVLIYRSSRVINFAVADLGVPIAALLAVMAGQWPWPHWPPLAFALLARGPGGAVAGPPGRRASCPAPRVEGPVATLRV